MQRYKEHLQKAKALRYFFTGLKYRRVKGLYSSGKFPSLARLMARDGPGGFSMVPVERVPAGADASIPETHWIKRMGVTLNRQLPFGGPDRLQWEGLLSRDDGERTTIRRALCDLIGAKGYTLTASEAVGLATRVVRSSDIVLFEDFFSIVKRII